MINNKEMIEILRKRIMAFGEKMKEADKIKRHLEADKSHLEVLITDEIDIRGMSTAEAALKAFEVNPNGPLSVSEVLGKMQLMGWRTEAAKPEGVVRGTLHRNPQFENVGRGLFRLRANVEETDTNKSDPKE